MFEEVKELLISMLNSSFSATTEKSRNRKIIFWYDAKKDYEELLDELELEDTEIIKYDNNSLWIRYHIEKEVKIVLYQIIFIINQVMIMMILIYKIE